MSTKRARGEGRRIWQRLHRERPAGKRWLRLELLEPRWVFDADFSLETIDQPPVDSTVQVEVYEIGTVEFSEDVGSSDGTSSDSSVLETWNIFATGVEETPVEWFAEDSDPQPLAVAFMMAEETGTCWNWDESQSDAVGVEDSEPTVAESTVSILSDGTEGLPATSVDESVSDATTEFTVPTEDTNPIQYEIVETHEKELRSQPTCFEQPVAYPMTVQTPFSTSQGLGSETGSVEDGEVSEESTSDWTSDKDPSVDTTDIPVDVNGEPILLRALTMMKNMGVDESQDGELMVTSLPLEEGSMVYALGSAIDETGELLDDTAPPDGDPELLLATGQPLAASDLEMISWVMNSWGMLGIDPNDAQLWAQASGEDAHEVHTLALDGAEWDFVVVDGEPQLVDNGENLFHNHALPEDTNGDGMPTPIDVLVIFNYLNAGHFQRLPHRVDQVVEIRYVDVDGSRTVGLPDANALLSTLSGSSASGAQAADESMISESSSARMAAPAAAAEVLFPVEKIPEAVAPWINELNLNENGDSASQGDFLVADLPTILPIPENVAVPDDVTVTIDPSATSFPTIDVDYSANDALVNGSLVRVSEANWGQVEWVEGAGPDGRSIFRYTPGEEFSGSDTFSYTVADEQGTEWTSYVNVSVQHDPTPFANFAFVMPQEQLTLESESLDFLNGEGEPLLSVTYEGPEGVTAGVVLGWTSKSEQGAKEVFAGKLESSVELPNPQTFNSLADGSAWIYGSLAEVNAALAHLRYIPAPGFQAPAGLTLQGYAFLQSKLGLALTYSFASLEVVVPGTSDGPVAVDDAFTFSAVEGEWRLDVLANDLAAPDAVEPRLEVISVTPWAHSSAQISIDAETGQIVYVQPTAYDSYYDTFAYLIRDDQGRLSQGQATINWNVSQPVLISKEAQAIEESVPEEQEVLEDSLASDEPLLSA